MEKKVVCCDSNVLIDLFHREERTVQEIDFLGYERLCISSVTVLEMYVGMRKSEAAKTRQLINRFNLFHFDKEISRRCTSLVYQYGNRLSIPDAIIAATVLTQGLELFTRNTQDFNFIPGLKLYRPRF